MKHGILTGLGGRGLWWLAHARQHPGCTLVACVEPHAPNRERAVTQYGVDPSQIYASIDDALNSVDADFVIDVTPPAVHHVIADKAFAAGLHVIGEKPLSDDFALAKRSAALGATAGRKHMVAQNYRFGAQPRHTRKLIAEGVSVQAITWNHPWGWHAGDAAHAIVFHYANGLVGTHISVGCTVGAQSGYNGEWRIDGPGGTLSWDNANRMWHHHLHRVTERMHRELFPPPVPPSEQTMLTEFFAAIDEDREPECSARDNLKSLAMVFGAIESAKTGQRVAI
jgi:predicted dehydrogenase